ncbi:hypothetical protein [Curtobacterium sp. ZW137]|nr:hypothetical protein [Curtobacterium sp. ZW137]ROP64948.1 hypothetical protein EDF55_1601 [Curtobacterium sp. ZW137]
MKRYEENQELARRTPEIYGVSAEDGLDDREWLRQVAQRLEAAGAGA